MIMYMSIIMYIEIMHHHIHEIIHHHGHHIIERARGACIALPIPDIADCRGNSVASITNSIQFPTCGGVG
jgi:hypothetical protein